MDYKKLFTLIGTGVISIISAVTVITQSCKNNTWRPEQTIETNIETNK